ncbi:unnamed protein product [Phaedon cochleariae]|uniref:Ubiquitin-like protein 7 n=1 Tax=Phaedon cochleariae TaxID=80249 RepID=A0A9P0DRM2_PHACE|nr:unnamed protein product [Phaedon cochleariae]
MVGALNVGIWKKEKFRRIRTENIDLQSDVCEFKKHVQTLLEKSLLDIELTFCGVILEDGNTLSSYGITNDVTIHVLEKPPSKPASIEKRLTPTEVVNSFRTLTLFSGYRSALQRLSRKDVLDKIIAAAPGLSDDPVALALIQDPELIVYLSDSESVGKMAQEHPILLDAASHIISHVHEEQANVNPNQATTSTGYSYSLEALSDDDDMDSSSDSNMAQNSLSRNSSFNAITAAQLAAAIANATNTQFNTNSAGVPSTTNSGSQLITNEMFSNAIQQAFAFGGGPATPSSNVNSGTSAPSEEDSHEASLRKWQAQLQQMHEMGLVNDLVNVRALKATNGDVNAAIELVLSLNNWND